MRRLDADCRARHHRRNASTASTRATSRSPICSCCCRSSLLPLSAALAVRSAPSPAASSLPFLKSSVTFAYKKFLAYILPELVPDGLVQLLSTDYKFAVSFVILVVVLLIRPTGIVQGEIGMTINTRNVSLLCHHGGIDAVRRHFPELDVVAHHHQPVPDFGDHGFGRQHPVGICRPVQCRCHGLCRAGWSGSGPRVGATCHRGVGSRRQWHCLVCAVPGGDHRPGVVRLLSHPRPRAHRAVDAAHHCRLLRHPHLLQSGSHGHRERSILRRPVIWADLACRSSFPGQWAACLQPVLPGSSAR